MVKVNVMLAEVRLDEFSEFGVEFGIQDSLVFDRGVGVIGFPFNQAGIGNNSDALALSTRELLAGQALSNLNIGRTNSTLGYGGLVLSAGNESIDVLVRALENRGLIRILSTPSITTVENLQGRVQVGQNVARVQGVTPIGNGVGGTLVTTDVEDVPTGVILEITPRVSPDGTIIMNVDAINSQLGSESEGTVVFINNDQVIRSPPINIIQAQTTVMARSGQTVAFSGLIQDTTIKEHRGTPILSDLPGIGPLFSYESDVHRRDELLIIMTPYLLNNEEQIEAQNQTDMDRMHWCLADVAEVYGPVGYGGFDANAVQSSAPPTYYPDEDPAGINPQFVPGDEGAAPMLPEPIDSPMQPPVPRQMRMPARSPAPAAAAPFGEYFETPVVPGPPVPDSSDDLSSTPNPGTGDAMPGARPLKSAAATLNQHAEPDYQAIRAGLQAGEASGIGQPDVVPGAGSAAGQIPPVVATVPAAAETPGSVQQVGVAAPLVPIIKASEYIPKPVSAPRPTGSSAPLPRVEYRSPSQSTPTDAGPATIANPPVANSSGQMQRIQNPYFDGQVRNYVIGGR